MKKFNSFSEFLKATPKNLISALTGTLLPIIFIIGAIRTKEYFEPPFMYYILIGFSALIIFMAWLRVYQIYKRLKK